MKLAVIANPKKYSVKETFINILEWADEHKLDILFSTKLRELYDGNNHPSAIVTQSEEKAIDRADIIIAIVEAGTMLYTPRLGKSINKPILEIGRGPCRERGNNVGEAGAESVMDTELRTHDA